jgi:DNA-binding NarL/FixJ family response regulator
MSGDWSTDENGVLTREYTNVCYNGARAYTLSNTDLSVDRRKAARQRQVFKSKWTDKREEIAAMMAAGKNSFQIAEHYGVTRNTIAGALWRLGLMGRNGQPIL